jgi:hypothetical protein
MSESSTIQEVRETMGRDIVGPINQYFRERDELEARVLEEVQRHSFYAIVAGHVGG